MPSVIQCVDRVHDSQMVEATLYELVPLDLEDITTATTRSATLRDAVRIAPLRARRSVVGRQDVGGASTTHGDAGTAKLMAHGSLGNARSVPSWRRLLPGRTGRLRA